MNPLPLLLTGCLAMLIGKPGHAQSDANGTFADCTALLQDGKKLHLDSIWGVHAGRLEYELDGSLHDLDVAAVSKVQCGQRSYTLSGDTLRLVMVPTRTASPAPANTSLLDQDGAIDYRALGKADAKKYYGGEGNLLAGMITAPLIIPPFIIAAVPPAPHMRHNPNAPLYFSQPEYKKGYRNQAHQKKAGLTIGGMTIGLLLVATLAAAMN